MIKNIGSIFALSLTICILLSVSLNNSEVLNLDKYSTEGVQLDYTVSSDAITIGSDLASLNVNNTYTPNLGKSFVGFKEALGFKESGGDYFTVNTYGYLGKYQFGKETLKMIGVYNPSQFLNNPKLQEEAFIANAARNKWILRKDIKKYVGKRMNGVVVTESGILAAAHLAGPGSVKKYLRSYGEDGFADAYGTTIQYYMKRFSGYDTSFIKPERRAKVASVS